MMQQVEISSGAYQSLQQIAAANGDDVSKHLDLAVKYYLDDIADAKEALQRLKAGEATYTSEEVDTFIAKLPQ